MHETSNSPPTPRSDDGLARYTPVGIGGEGVSGVLERGFEADLRAVLATLRRAMAELFASVGSSPTRPQDLARQLGLNKNLTWKIAKVIRETDPAVVIPHIPGKSGFVIILKAFDKAGAPKPALEYVRHSLRAFDRLVEQHAGDRETLERMLGGTSAKQKQQLELHRKLSFRGNSATWGVQARVHLSSYILAPSAERDDMLDLGLLCGLLDFQRLRSDVAWAVATMSGFHDEPRADSSTALPPGTIHDLDRFTAVDPDYAAPGAAPLIGDFCSQPPPPLRAVPGAPGTRRYELVEGPVGKTAAVTCVTGLIRRGAAPRYRSTADQFGEVMVTLTTPVEMAILDLLVHRSMMESMPPSAHLYSLLPGGPVYPRAGRDHGLLPMSERVSELGSGLGVPDIVTPEVPRYTQMVRRMLAAGGWSLGDFVGYRLRIKFPPIPTLAVLRFGLPAAPAQVVTIPALARAKT